VLIALTVPDRLSSGILSAVERGPNVLSVVSYWEVVIKQMKGKLDVGDPRVWWDGALNLLLATPLPIRPGHVAGLWELLAIHQDPFDRMLVSQATAEDLTLVTMDAVIAGYGSKALSVLS